MLINIRLEGMSYIYHVFGNICKKCRIFLRLEFSLRDFLTIFDQFYSLGH